MNIAKVIDVASGREAEIEVVQEKPIDKLALQKQNWLTNPITREFLENLEKLRTEAIEDAENKASIEASSKAIRRILIKAKTIRDIIDYGKRFNPGS